MRHMPTVLELMKAFPVHVEEQTSLAEAATLMLENHCHHLPVMVEHEVVGLLTHADIELARQPGHAVEESSELAAGDLCHRDIPQIDLHTRLDVVLDMMTEGDHDALLIVRHERLAGLLTAQDACRGFSRWLKKEYLPTDDPGAA